ncbi:MAG: sensor histidine kinase [Clostridiales bacterium]|nr:sensor histidine kinase [Clostridiales bacterium]
MKELALHILDVAQNSISAGARRLALALDARDNVLTVSLADDGCGMSPELLAAVTSPFTTTRTTRKVGLGLPLLRLAAEQTGGRLSVESAPGRGTTVTAVFHTGHIDCPPLGDLAGTLALVVQGSPRLTLSCRHTTPLGSYFFSTEQVRGMLGPDIPLDTPEVILWLTEYLRELEQSVTT